jgi:hypothetical protein
MWQERQALMLHYHWGIIQLLVRCNDHAAAVSKDNVAAAGSLALLYAVFVITQVCNIPNILPATKAHSCTATAAAAAAQALLLLQLQLLSSSSNSST